jgi:hypothetical protein
MAHNTKQSVPSYTENNRQQNLTPQSYNRTNFLSRTRMGDLLAGAEPTAQSVTTARFASTNDSTPDWRVKIKVPFISTFKSSAILAPLYNTDGFAVFPVTPSITMSTSASYDSLTPTHSNYGFPQYINSNHEDITISGQFPVQTEDDGQYWVACVHFFRSLTKMFYGESSEKGAPPPVVKLSGYGDYVLNNVPVVVTNFSFDLPTDVDYIQVNTTKYGDYASTYQMVPTNSTLTVIVRPTYSRSKISSFNMDEFINGNLANKGFI